MLLTGGLVVLGFTGACGRDPANAPPPAADSTPAQPDRTAQARRLHAQAMQQIADDKYVEAVSLLAQAAERAPGDWRILADLGTALKQLRRYQQARDSLLRAAELAEEPAAAPLRMQAAECSHRLAHEAYTAGQNESALKHIGDALELRGGDPDLQMLRGYVHHRLREYVEAERAFALAVGSCSGARRHDALRWQGQARFDGKNYVGAVETLTIVIREGNTSHDVYGLRGYALNQLGRNMEARSDFLNAAEFAATPEKRQEYLAAAASLLQDPE
jgi:Flp pilus assembly protein TadD